MEVIIQRWCWQQASCDVKQALCKHKHATHKETMVRQHLQELMQAGVQLWCVCWHFAEQLQMMQAQQRSPAGK